MALERLESSWWPAPASAKLRPDPLAVCHGGLQVAREGTKKTVFINFMELCKSMNRNHEHVLVRAAVAGRCAASLLQQGAAGHPRPQLQPSLYFIVTVPPPVAHLCARPAAIPAL